MGLKKTTELITAIVSKSALNMLNRSLSIELKNEKIITLVVNPGWVKTDMGGDSADLTVEQSVRGMIDSVIYKATIKSSGCFYSYTGELHPW